MTKQSKIFMKSEGDNWFKRNRNANFGKDYPLMEIEKIIKNFKEKKKVNILEIGCSQGKRLSELQKKYKCNCFGVEPSYLAIKNKINNKVNIKRGTAEKLDFPKKKFDIIFFGFCLYVVDVNDLFLVASEANRVLKDNGYIIIWDFDSKLPKRTSYKHDKQILTFKFEFVKIFLWSPLFKLLRTKKYKLLNKNNFNLRIDSMKKTSKIK